MLPTRYSFIVADRLSGVVHRFTLAVRPTLVLIAAILALPIGWTVQSRWSTAAEIEQLQLRNATLSVENIRYRSATTELSGRISRLQLAIDQLRRDSIVDPEIRRAILRLPVADTVSDAALRSVALSSPTAAFNLLDDLLDMLNVQLLDASQGIEHQQAFAAATPINLPVDGRVTGRFGTRPDPFTGQRASHRGIDISTGFGRPIYATADGTVGSAQFSGNLGNLVEIEHGFGLVTRYGHLSKFATTAGSTVSRGDVIGYTGDTGRATAVHLHYEVWVNGRPINPLQLGARPRSQSAN